MKSIVVLISGNGSNLQAILDQTLSGEINGKISAVISNQADAFGLTRASNAQVPAITLSHKAFADRESYDHALQAKIDEFAPDLVVLAGFMRILTAEFVNHYAGRMINIHPSLLPKYKGLNTFARALEDNEHEHGASVHFVTPDLDGGPVIAQAVVPIEPNDDVESLKNKVQRQERIIYPKVVNWFCSNNLKLVDNKVWYEGNPLGETGLRY